jgi:hypothetical protein
MRGAEVSQRQEREGQEIRHAANEQDFRGVSQEAGNSLFAEQPGMLRQLIVAEVHRVAGVFQTARKVEWAER